MLSAIIAAHESERTLVPTLSALVPGATAGLIGEVVWRMPARPTPPPRSPTSRAAVT